MWDPRDLPDQSGASFLITGSNAGLGYFAAEQLARAGARVIMTGRNPNRLAAARAAVERRVPQAASSKTVETLLLDTSNLGSVRAAAATARAHGKLDGLLLNAGVVHPPQNRQTTTDGHELVYATNVLGHFALAGEMLTALAAGLGRMVWLGSMSTSMWRYSMEQPELSDVYTPWRAYVQSKIATTSLGFEADRRLRQASIPVTSVVAHPGYSVSGRTVGIRGVNAPSRWNRFLDNLQTPITQSKEQGAHALVRALIDPEIGGGEYWGPSRIANGAPRRQQPPRQTRDPELGARLWRLAEDATGVSWPPTKGKHRGRPARRGAGSSNE